MQQLDRRRYGRGGEHLSRQRGHRDQPRFLGGGGEERRGAGLEDPAGPSGRRGRTVRPHDRARTGHQLPGPGQHLLQVRRRRVAARTGSASNLREVSLLTFYGYGLEFVSRPDATPASRRTNTAAPARSTARITLSNSRRAISNFTTTSLKYHSALVIQIVTSAENNRPP